MRKIGKAIAKSPEANCSAPLLAHKIATELLTMYGSKHECTRAQLMLMQEDGTEKNMGGRNKESIIIVIERNLRDAGL